MSESGFSNRDEQVFAGIVGAEFPQHVVPLWEQSARPQVMSALSRAGARCRSPYFVFGSPDAKERDRLFQTQFHQATRYRALVDDTYTWIDREDMDEIFDWAFNSLEECDLKEYFTRETALLFGEGEDQRIKEDLITAVVNSVCKSEHND